MAAFIAERCETGKDKTATAKALYEAYQGWAESNAELVVSKTAFGLRLREHEFDVTTSGSGRSGVLGWNHEERSHPSKTRLCASSIALHFTTFGGKSLLAGLLLSLRRVLRFVAPCRI